MLQHFVVFIAILFMIYSRLSTLAGKSHGWRSPVGYSAKSQTRLSDFTFTSYFHALENEMATHSSVLAWRIPGTEEPVGLPSMGSHRVRHQLTQRQQQHVYFIHSSVYNSVSISQSIPPYFSNLNFFFKMDYASWIAGSQFPVQFSSVAQLCPTFCDSMDCNRPGFPVHHQLSEFTRTHVH